MQHISYSNMKDTALWDLVLKGDMEALSLLYKKHYELLLNFGINYILDEDFVKDCIQDVFVKICMSKQLSPTEYVRSYLLTSLKNMIADKLSSLKMTEDLDEFFDLKIEDTALETLFKDNDEALQLSKKLVNAYRSLPQNQRMSIYLHYIKGLSYKEMAVVLNIAPQSSMNLVSRALTNLRSKMTLENYLLIIILFIL